ncbi:MAG: hypothetical protein KGH72_06120 [Candidatus Micrarchaeota archaeon]|nr:hypothetical protein [Candidatus Micrarchaeota archaeon]
MPQYAVIQSHEAGICPMTNKAVREFLMSKMPDQEGLKQKLGVKVLLEIHLDPDHKAFMLFEAKTAEAVRDYLVQAGYTHYLRTEFHMVTPIAELLAQAKDMPTIY